MAMAEHSILVGKSYRTPDNEVREVSAMDKGDVVYRPVSTTSGLGVLWGPAQRKSLLKSKAKFLRMPSDRCYATAPNPPAVGSP